MNKRILAFVLAFSASFIYGVSFTIAKDVMPLYIMPYGFIFLRVSGAMILFWVISLFVKREKIATKDFIRILFAALFGVVINMLTFFKGLSMTTPINGSVIMTTSPIIVLLFSFLILGDKITFRKVIGVLLGMIGAVLLIIYGPNVQANAPNIKWGNFLVFVNATSYALYLIVAKPLLKKYHPVHLVKWIYLIGFVFVLPFGFSEVMQVSWAEVPQTGLLKIGFIVVFTTFFTYLFNITALKQLKATTLSVFLYLQPLIASIYAIIMGSDYLTTLKVTAAVLIFTGVYLVSYKKKQIPAIK